MITPSCRVTVSFYEINAANIMPGGDGGDGWKKRLVLKKRRL